MTDEPIEGIELRGTPPTVRQARKGPLALVALLVLIVLSTMAYALYQRAQPTLAPGAADEHVKRAFDASAATALTAQAPAVIPPFEEPPAAPVEAPPVTLARIPALPALAAGPAPPQPIDPTLAEATRAAAELRQQAIEASMEVPLGLGDFGGNPGTLPVGMPAPAAGPPAPDRNERLLDGVQRALAGVGLGATPDPNGQDGKLGFIENLQHLDPPPALTGPQPPANPYVIRTGTVIPMALISGANSDLPGMLTAQVSQHVYDTPRGRWVLIPQGTRLVGQYDARVTFGQDRLLVVWNRLIYPDGSTVELGGMPGADQAAYAGLADQVDHHYVRIFGSALLLSLVSAGFEIATDDGNDRRRDESNTAREAVARQMAQVAGNLLERNLNIQPTITIRNGQIGSVMVNKDLYLRPWNPQLARWETM